MSNAQTAANNLHELGFSDTEIASLIGVSREYVNRIRSGKKTASYDLETKLLELERKDVDDIIGMLEGTQPNTLAEEDTPYESEYTGSSNTFFDKLVTFGGIAFFGALFVAGLLRKPSQTQTTQQN